jgi:hypothetical protein
VEAGIEHASNSPALGHIAELIERAQVAKEALRLVGGLEAQDRLEQRLDLGSLPVVGHVTRFLPASPARGFVVAY